MYIYIYMLGTALPCDFDCQAEGDEAQVLSNFREVWDTWG